jgi:peptide/nickel transport system substrate-binding protein
MTIRIMPEESSIIAALRTGEVHHAVLEDNKNYDLVKNNPSLQTWRTPALGTNVININHRKEPLSKQRVRQALSMAIDRDEILQAAGSGLGAVSGPIPSSHPLWTVPTANLPFYTPDPAGAKAALNDAGYPNGFDLDIIYIPQFPLMDISAQVLAAQWQKIGINASPRATEYGVWLDLRVKTFDYWISTNLDFPTLDPDQYLYNTFHTGSSPAGWDNWSDAEIDALLDQGRASTDQAQRALLYSQAQQKLCEKVAAFWSYSADHVDVATQQLLGFTPHPTTMLFGLPSAALAG